MFERLADWTSQYLPKDLPKSLIAGLIGGLIAGAALCSGETMGAGLPTIAGNESTYDSLPLTGVEAATPLVMLTLSRDHQLHYKAYDDTSDLDGDGIPETTYKGNLGGGGSFVGYYGYFDPRKCYSYGNGLFSPVAMATFGADESGLPNTATGKVPYCNGQWSGNFLNWVAMTRIDALRKLLYGGLRSTDSATQTILERDYLPTDAHAFAKYYNGADISRLTPFRDIANTTLSNGSAGEISATAYAAIGIKSISRSSSTATVTTSENNPFITGEAVFISNTCNDAYNGIKIRIVRLSSTRFAYKVNGLPGACTSAAGSAQLVLPVVPSAGAPVALGDQLSVVRDAVNYMDVVVTSLLNGNGTPISSTTAGTAYVQMSDERNGASPIVRTVGAGASTSLVITDLTTTGISFCNLTPGSTETPNVNLLSQSNNNPPLLRVARGNYSLWSANHGYQCHWLEETSAQQAGFGSGLRSNSNRAPVSGLDASAENPIEAVAGLGAASAAGLSTAVAAGEYVVRVQACAAGKQGSERCERYPTRNPTYPAGVEKPTGLLQLYGETGRIHFGLLTPSYQKSGSGGVVRKNIGSLADEIHVDTDGSFVGTVTGIIGNIDRLRIYGYDYASGAYDSANGDTCRRGPPPAGDGSTRASVDVDCTGWGNPIGEAFVESLRYFAGKTPDSRFTYAGASRDAALGLTAVSNWIDPLARGDNNFCASLDVLLLNAGVPSYDDDQMDRLADLPGAPSAAAYTNALGADEGISGNFIVGSNGAVNDAVCNSKAVTDLASVTGACPQGPGLEGSYLLDGAAFFAHTNRIRSDLNAIVPSTDTHSLKVTTYGIQLTSQAPSIVIKDPADPTRILAKLVPAYRFDAGNASPYDGGTVTDFRIVSQDLAAGRGRFRVAWENDTRGRASAQELSGTIAYQVNADKTVTVTTSTVADSGIHPQGFGYIISGTTQDGPHFHSGILGFSYDDAARVTVNDASGHPLNGSTFAARSPGISTSGGCAGCLARDPETSVTYSLDGAGSSANFLHDPLLYAAKYGGFRDDQGANGSAPDGTPANTDGTDREWDSHTANGGIGGDGLPDNYFPVFNPGQLEASLGSMLDTIVARASSGAAASVVANSRQGEGAVYQALYATSRSDSHDRTVRWIGNVQALFVDRAGNLREDGNGDMQLEESDFAADPAIRISYEGPDQGTRVIRYHGDPATTAGDPPAALDTLRPLWNANTVLSRLTDPLKQRDYNTALVKASDGSYSGGRYIIAFRDHRLGASPDNGMPGQGSDIVDFTAANFGAGEYGMLNVASASDAETLVDYIRGKENSRLRSRSLDLDGDGHTQVMRLGDVVNSSPIAVAAPAEALNLLYGDQSYDAFFKKYRKRRNVVYVGANDGMIHAFNAGFYDPATRSFRVTAGNSETPHPLGAELWAYVPFNLLPHLAWLSDPAYRHVWYADGSPRVFDARIFAADGDHPDGWGTVLVVGMRFGGAPISLPVNNATRAGFTGYAAALGKESSITTRSAYAVIDITNPESPPKVLAELTDAGGKLGFTTSYPTVAAFRPQDGSTPEKWYLVYGSGPTGANVLTTLNSAESSQNGQLFIYDLAARRYVAGYGPYDLGAAAPNSFIGNPVAVDWDLNGKADVLYFGTSGSSTAVQTGQLFRLDFRRPAASGHGPDASGESSLPGDWTPPAPLLNAGAPVLATPSVTLDSAGRKWVLSGTGRLFSNSDKSNIQQQALFGVIDSSKGETKAAASLSGLVDTTRAAVTAGAGTPVSGVAGVTNEADLEARIIASGGWKRGLALSPLASERSVANTSLLSQILFATTYMPAPMLCGGDGDTRLFALNFQSGAALPSPVTLGTRTRSNADGSTALIANDVVDLGPGLGAAPTIHVDNNGAPGDGALTINVQRSNGSVSQTRTRTTGRERSGEIDWRETHPNSNP